MKILATITGILAQMKTEGSIGDWLYQSPTKANIVLDDVQGSPVAVLYLVTDRNLSITGQLIKERADINLFILDGADLDFDGLMNEGKIDDMAEVAIDFVRRVRAVHGLRIQGDSVAVRSVYDENDTNLTGVSLQFTLEDIQGKCYADNQQNED